VLPITIINDRLSFPGRRCMCQERTTVTSEQSLLVSGSHLKIRLFKRFFADFPLCRVAVDVVTSGECNRLFSGVTHA